MCMIQTDRSRHVAAARRVDVMYMQANVLHANIDLSRVWCRCLRTESNRLTPTGQAPILPGDVIHERRHVVG